MEWPTWWDWELEFCPHVLKRMMDRDFSEVDLRHMLEYSVGLRADVVEGRWVVETWRERRAWEVIVEPDFETQLLIIVTAYPVYGQI